MDGINFQNENSGPHQMNDKLCDLKWHYILTDEHDQVECRDLLSGLEKLCFIKIELALNPLFFRSVLCKKSD